MLDGFYFIFQLFDFHFIIFLYLYIFHFFLSQTRHVNVAVLDEMQMLSDINRGHNWTRALLGIYMYFRRMANPR